jgi:hypothetical protein
LPITPTGLVRYQDTGNFHFVTFSCYRRQPLLATLSGYGIFERELEQVDLPPFPHPLITRDSVFSFGFEIDSQPPFLLWKCGKRSLLSTFP